MGARPLLIHANGDHARRHEPTQAAAARARKNLAGAADAQAQGAQAGGRQPLVRLMQSASAELHHASWTCLGSAAAGRPAKTDPL